MKKILTIIFILILLAPVLAIQTETSEDNILRIDFLRSNPSPIATDSEGELVFQVTNLHTKVLNNLEFELASTFPITAIQNKVIIEPVYPGQTRQFSFKVKTKKGVPDGTYTIGLQYKQPIFGKYTSAQFTIPVKTISRAIASTMIKTEPEQIPPGSKAKIFIDFQNGATYSMKDIVIKLNFTDTIPIAPYASTTEKSISILKPKESKLIDFDIIALPDAVPNIYRLPITITYDDELGTENTKLDELGIIIASEPEYMLNIEDSTIIKYVKSSITASISNTGPSDIKYMVIEVLPNKYYQVVGQNKAYLGNLESDDYETEEFDIFPLKSGKISVDFKLTYKDALNKEIIETKQVQTDSLSKIQARNLGVIPKSGIKKLFFYIILIVFIYLTYKNWRKEKNLPLAMKKSARTILIFFMNIIRNLHPSKIKKFPHKIRIFLIKLR